jgi:hypothetical protein
MRDNKIVTEKEKQMTDNIIATEKKQMTDNIIATERKTNDRQYNSHRKKNKSQTI